MRESALHSSFILYLLAVLTTAVPSTNGLRFSSPPYDATVSEAAPIGTNILNLTAIPNAPGANLVFNIFNQPLPLFEVGRSTGAVFTIDFLDYEQETLYSFNAEVIEGSDSVMTSITVHVTNEDDNPLTCTTQLVVIAVVEGPSQQSSPVPLGCVDLDEPGADSVAYHIVSESSVGLFAVDADSLVSISTELDYEEQIVYEAQVNITNSGVSFVQSSLLITILLVVEPVNEYYPVFDGGGTYSVSITETATVGTTVATLSASDDDAGEDGELIYSFEFVSPENPFHLDPSSGDIILVQSLDYEQSVLYELTVLATDSSADIASRHSATASVSVMVENRNEFPPKFLQEVYYVAVSEMEHTGSIVTQVECSDSDSDSLLMYSLLPSSSSGLFQIDPSTGVVTSVTMLEYSISGPNTHKLTVQCEDSRDSIHYVQAPLLVEVEGHSGLVRAPSLPASEYPITLEENTTLGATVVTIAASDSNRGLLGPLQFSLTYSDGCPSHLFYIDAISGTMYVIGALDFETAPEHFCVVSVFNIGSPSNSNLDVDVIISVTNVNDESPVCTPSLHTLAISEDSSIGSELLTFSCSDADTNSLQYTFVTPSTRFELNSNGYEATLSLHSALDSDTFSTFNLHINVSDGNFHTLVSILVFINSSNEHAPQFSSNVYDCTVAESAEIGTRFCSVAATDADSGADGEVHYTLDSGSEDNTFAVNEDGDVILTGLIDHEDVNGYMFYVYASDSGVPALSSTAQVRVRVIDRNDNAPVISALITLSVSENTTTGTTITVIECSDIDSGMNGETNISIQNIISLNHAMEENTESGTFTIVQSSSEFVLSSNLDYEEHTVFQIHIECSDHGTPPLSSRSEIVVSVIPVNEFSPIFPQTSYSVTLAESTAVGTHVLAATATDGDAGVDSLMQYSITPAEGEIPFLQISSTGEIATARLIDCGLGREHVFTITAIDRGHPVRSSEVELTVSLNGCLLGDIRPQRAVYSTSVSENAVAGTPILTVRCTTTREWGDDFAPQYTISSSSSPFHIDLHTGAITISTPPDYEESPSYLLQITCRDPNDITSHATFFAYITITPENEHTPQFIRNLYETEVPEDTLPGTSLLRVEASDEDTSSHGDILYSIQDSEHSDMVAVDTNTGVIYLVKYLDREGVSLVAFHVAAADQEFSDGLVHSSSTEVRISVADRNDNIPACEQAVYHIQVSPLTEIGDSLLHLSCFDADIGSNADLSYSLSSESLDTEQLFSVDANSGELRLRRNFNLNSAAIHYITVIVEDQGTPPHSTSVAIVVDVAASKSVEVDEDEAMTEGLKNSITLTLDDLSIKLWNEGGSETFLSAVAQSITQYCALFPNSCSLQSGCTHFDRQKRSTEETPYIPFSEEAVIFLSPPLEFSKNSGDYTYLNITFYIRLPADATRAEFRTTDHVIPRQTLGTALEEGEEVIEAQVRDSVSSPLTTSKSSDEGFPLWVWGLVIVASVIILVLIVAVVVLAVMQWKKRNKGTKVFPINDHNRNHNLELTQTTLRSRTNIRPNESRTSIPLIVHRPSLAHTLVQRPSFQTSTTLQDSYREDDIDTDDVSTIHLDSEETSTVSMQAILGSPQSTTGSLDSRNLSTTFSMGSTAGKSGSSRDFMDNFPYEPPRAGREPKILRMGHAKIGRGWIGGRQS